MKRDKSREMFEWSKRSLVGGLSSWVRGKEPVPLFFKGGKGSKLYDVDGNEYIDYVMVVQLAAEGSRSHRRERLIRGVQRLLDHLVDVGRGDEPGTAPSSTFHQADSTLEHPHTELVIDSHLCGDPDRIRTGDLRLDRPIC